MIMYIYLYVYILRWILERHTVFLLVVRCYELQVGHEGRDIISFFSAHAGDFSADHLEHPARSSWYST